MKLLAMLAAVAAVMVFGVSQAGSVGAGEPTFQRIGWGPTRTSSTGTYLVKSITIPPGTWHISLPLRFRWGYMGVQTSTSNLSVFWANACPMLTPADPGYDPAFPRRCNLTDSNIPAGMAYSDQLMVEAGAPGDADSMYLLSADITVTVPIDLAAVVEVAGENVCTLVDGDGSRYGTAG